ncbi:MAG: ABC transporter ATP-binding protein [Bacteroidales bacterium]|nr:ABC transporter ATP-binding protein [Bacteroidales bacterium]
MLTKLNKDVVLRIENLSIGFNPKQAALLAVKNISFELKRNTILGVVGESGSGKSVSSLSILRLLQEPPAHYPQGKIWLHTKEGEIDILQLDKSKMENIRGRFVSMIFQEPMTSLNPTMKCGEQIIEAILAHQKVTPKEAKKRALELMHEVMLPRPNEIFNVYPHEISGGQKQRIMIAMALSSNPEVLIADEPTTALDVTVQKTILELLIALKDKYGMSILFITHDLGVIADIADDVLVMYKGEVVEQGNAKNIFKNPQHPYTKGLLHCRPNIEKRTYRLPTIHEFLLGEKELLKDRFKEVSLNDRTLNHAQIYAQEPLLVVESLEKSFVLKRTVFGKTTAKHQAVNKVSFEIYKGETMGLVGESGCGKTTLGRTLMRLLEPSSGKIHYQGMDVTKMSKKDLQKFRQKVQIIFQDPYSSLNPRISVGEAIMEPMFVHKTFGTYKECEEYAHYLMDKVALSKDSFNRYPHEFSGGQRQRVCIARSLSLKPELIICDESVSALDVSVQAQVLNLLNDLKEDFGLTYVFISHDLSVVKYMSDRMMVMKDGNMVEFGDSDAIYAHPQTTYTQGLIASIPGLQ